MEKSFSQLKRDQIDLTKDIKQKSINIFDAFFFLPKKEETNTKKIYTMLRVSLSTLHFQSCFPTSLLQEKIILIHKVAFVNIIIIQKCIMQITYNK